MNSDQHDLKTLLNRGLPLERVGPHLRHAARRAVLANDQERMKIVGKVIVAELLRRGDLLRVAIQGHPSDKPVPHFVLVKGEKQLLDLGVLGQPLSDFDWPGSRLAPEEIATLDQPPVPASSGQQPLESLDSVLLAMEDAQQLDVSDPRSRENSVILDSILALLGKFTPQFELHCMLFEPTDTQDVVGRVFHSRPHASDLPWFKTRKAGQSVWFSNTKELPSVLQPGGKGSKPSFSAVAVPLHEPQPTHLPLAQREECGLIFVLAPESWSRDTMLRLATRLSRFVTHRWQQHTEMNKLVHIDALTGLFNKRFFESQFELLLERARRSQSPLTLIMADIDHFKQVNEDYDHMVGDLALQLVARRLQEELRRIDMICRVGGEELALILPNTDQAAAQDVLIRLMDAPIIQPLDTEGNKIDLRITLSYGAVTYPDSGEDALELYRKADTLLFLSKDRGRNQCHFWSSDGKHLQLLPSQD